jgi:type I restriction enzyme M protein
MPWHKPTGRETARRIDTSLARHKALEDEAKTLKVTIKGIETNAMNWWPARGRRSAWTKPAPSSSNASKPCCCHLPRLPARRTAGLHQGGGESVEQVRRDCAQIEAERDEASRQLQAFLVELGYE